MAIKNGSIVTLDYKVYVDDQLVDQSTGGMPLVFTQGQGQIIPGLEKALEGLNKGDKKEIIVMPEDAYGVYHEDRVLHIPREELPSDIEPELGLQLQAVSEGGDVFVGVVSNIENDHIDVDFNHPMAGKTLRFEIEVQDVQD